MRMVVVKARAVPQHKVTLDLNETQFALRILREVIGLICVLPQLRDPESTNVRMRIFAAIIPAHPHARFGGAPNESDRLRNNVELFGGVAKNADLRFEAELYDRVQLGSIL